MLILRERSGPPSVSDLCLCVSIKLLYVFCSKNNNNRTNKQTKNSAIIYKRRKEEEEEDNKNKTKKKKKDLAIICAQAPVPET